MQAWKIKHCQFRKYMYAYEEDQNMNISNNTADINTEVNIISLHT